MYYLNSLFLLKHNIKSLKSLAVFCTVLSFLKSLDKRCYFKSCLQTNFPEMHEVVCDNITENLVITFLKKEVLSARLVNP